MEYKNPHIISVIIIIIVVGIFFVFYFQSESDDFETDVLFLKVAVAKGGIAVNNIKITSLKDSEYRVEVEGDLDSLVRIDKSKFFLNSGDEIYLKVKFDTGNKTPGIYLGFLKISSEKQIQEIPIILEIQTSEVLFDGNLNLFPKGEDYNPSQKIIADIKIYDLENIGQSDVNLAYFLKDFKGRTLESGSEKVIVDREYEFSKTFDLSGFKLGGYVVGVVIDYQGSVGIVSSYFRVKEGEEIFIRNWIIVIGLLVLLILGFFIFLLLYRDKLMKDFRKEYKKEIRKQMQLIYKRRRGYDKLSLRGKRAYKKELGKIKKKRLKGLKKTYVSRVKKLSRIRRKKGKKAFMKELAKWKDKGYDTSVLEKKYKLPSISKVRSQINKWKKEGYDTSVLKRN